MRISEIDEVVDQVVRPCQKAIMKAITSLSLAALLRAYQLEMPKSIQRENCGREQYEVQEYLCDCSPILRGHENENITQVPAVVQNHLHWSPANTRSSSWEASRSMNIVPIVRGTGRKYPVTSSCCQSEATSYRELYTQVNSNSTLTYPFSEILAPFVSASRSYYRRWLFDLNRKNDALGTFQCSKETVRVENDYSTSRKAVKWYKTGQKCEEFALWARMHPSHTVFLFLEGIRLCFVY
ncbi:predicted protein [Aspergillus nidulans FGSC A4]|uniref:Uncharacterized protein n=1 Tax=Emericella nidulans (strain FGSC A4 / ATCC 38163 / CBS 112.46 / NRRL 194 / M139) TaxID=227321 RepID=Q5AX20_EMENI|nr:hypothetical protein [Aspergillus nidulans FGSC A4]EAA61412.1 predicted protein [Aspergillus nidulans FGSC A4]CBF78957.1 TPA: conserved hypothetical protein [Aspergillus nidulans FGSC A4]|eukprot:XP_664764.1 predicted protein [Aspergillus nidulans FGSC A4]